MAPIHTSSTTTPWMEASGSPPRSSSIKITTSGALVNSLVVPNSSQNGVLPKTDQMVTSFSSKSELALNLSTDGNYLTFMGYLAPIDAIDVSNSNTPEVVDPTNPVGESVY